MKFAFSLKNKLKIAFFLFCIMCCSLLIRFLEDKSVAKINESFISMYKDRLVPATDLYFIAENLYQKNTILRDAVADYHFSTDNSLLKIKKHNRKIDSVINKYELTVLVKEEQHFLVALKQALHTQQQVEHKVLGLGAEERKVMFEATAKKAASHTLEKLSELIRIQSKVGDELVNDSKIFVSGTKVYSTLQGVLAIIIGIMIVSIVSASNMVKIQNDKYNLN